MPWVSTYDKHATADAARKDMERRQRFARKAGKSSQFRVVRRGDYYIVEINEG
jgi:hypothetical protein